MIHAIAHQIIIIVLYGGMFAVFFASIFWKPIAGLCYVIPMLPLSTLVSPALENVAMISVGFVWPWR